MSSLAHRFNAFCGLVLGFLILPLLYIGGGIKRRSFPSADL